MHPSIAIVGSGTPGREYSPALVHGEALRGACEDLGQELAHAGCDLIVFSSGEEYIERDVVRGYLRAAGAVGSVVVRTPARRDVRFDVPAHVLGRISVEPDTAGYWESAFYRSVFAADGLVVVGGGRTTRITGVIAIARQTPLVALASFGAAAAVVWEHLERSPNDATRDDLNLMGRPWSADSARLLVRSLLDQLARRDAVARAQIRAQSRVRRSRTLSSLIGSAALVLVAATILIAWTHVTTAVAIGCLLAGPMLGAIGGAMLRDTTDEEPHAVWSAARGLGAGLLAVTLYVASQLLTAPDLLTVAATRRLLWLVNPLGIAAGYTFDLVYARLRRVRVVDFGSIAQDRDSSPPGQPGRVPRS